MNARASDRMLCGTIAVLTAIEFLQLSMTAFAAGPIMGELGLTPEDFSLIAAVYASVAILMISMQRWLVERLGGRLVIHCAAAISMLGSVLCATSTGFGSFLLGRIVMAIGGGALFTSARMIIHHLLAGPRRFTGIRALGTSLALSIAAGPWIAAEAVSMETWSAIYWLVAQSTAPISDSAVAYCRNSLPPSRVTNHRCMEMTRIATLAYTAAIRLKSSGVIPTSPMIGPAPKATMLNCRNSIAVSTKIVA